MKPLAKLSSLCRPQTLLDPLGGSLDLDSLQPRCNSDNSPGCAVRSFFRLTGTSVSTTVRFKKLCRTMQLWWYAALPVTNDKLQVRRIHNCPAVLSPTGKLTRTAGNFYIFLHQGLRKEIVLLQLFRRKRKCGLKRQIDGAVCSGGALRSKWNGDFRLETLMERE